MKNNYSPKELWMIREISPHWYNIINEGRDSSIMPPNVLRILAEECFINGKTGPAVESLRRVLKAFHGGKIYRMTPEYEALITEN
jgi:hypothetical protein